MLIKHTGVAVYFLFTKIDMKAINATVANAAAISSKTTAARKYVIIFSSPIQNRKKQIC